MKMMWPLGFVKGMFVLLIAGCPILCAPLFAQSNAPEKSADSLVTVVAGPQYSKSRFYQFFFGKHYRKVWAAPVQARVFRITTEMNGLEAMETGGSYQTKNLRLRTKKGKGFVLRSVDKNPTQKLSGKWQNSFVGKIIRDQTSVIHPFGYYIIPSLSDAVGVYHTNPQLVFIPDDPALGPFRSEFANMLAMLEERPEGNRQEVSSFGNSALILSSRKALEQVFTNPCHRVDAQAFLRARLFDVLIGDWSRREDQWRWATFPSGKATLYRGIPRDRDHAFFKFDDGLITWIASRFSPNLRSFHHKIRNLEGIVLSGKPMDSSFLVFLSEEDFTATADAMKASLTDSVIDKAISVWPQNIQDLTGKEFRSKLRARRDQLPKVAEDYYRLLAEEVEIPGSDENDRFVVEQLTDGTTKISLFSSSAICFPDSLLGSRIFKPGETRVVRLFGLGGNDIVDIRSQKSGAIKLEINGGEGKDSIAVRQPNSRDRQQLKIIVFDPGDGDQITGSELVTVEKDYKPLAQEYHAKGWLLRHQLH